MIRPRFSLPQFVLVLSYAFLLSVRECRAFATVFCFTSPAFDHFYFACHFCDMSASAARLYFLMLLHLPANFCYTLTTFLVNTFPARLFQSPHSLVNVAGSSACHFKNVLMLYLWWLMQMWREKKIDHPFCIQWLNGQPVWQKMHLCYHFSAKLSHVSAKWSIRMNFM